MPAIFSVVTLTALKRVNCGAGPYISSVEGVQLMQPDIAMHRLSSLALASVFAVQVGRLSFQCASEEMLLEPELPCQQVLATSTSNSVISVSGYIGCWK